MQMERFSESLFTSREVFAGDFGTVQSAIVVGSRATRNLSARRSGLYRHTHYKKAPVWSRF
jgi:hypothetical protein